MAAAQDCGPYPTATGPASDDLGRFRCPRVAEAAVKLPASPQAEKTPLQSSQTPTNNPRSGTSRPAQLTAQTERYLNHRAVRLSANSLVAYRADCRLLWRCLAITTDPTLDTDDTATVEAAVAALTTVDLTIDNLAGAFAHIRAGAFRGKGSGPRSDATVRRLWACATAVCSWLVSRRHLEGNPMAGVDNAARPDIQPKALSDSQVRSVLDAAASVPLPGVRIRWPGRDTALVLVGVLAGLRASEIVQLSVGAIRQRDDSLTLHVTGKGRKERSVPVAAPLAEALEVYLNERANIGAPHADPVSSRPRMRPGTDRNTAIWERIHPGEPVFVTTKGTPMSRQQLDRIVDHVYRQAGLARGIREDGVAAHALRHTFATRLHERGASSIEIQRLLGHASPVTTERYVKTTAADLRHLVSGMASLGPQSDS